MTSSQKSRIQRPAAANPAGYWLVFAGPALLLYVVFVALPTIMSLIKSFTNENPFNPPTAWIGTQNYATLVADPAFLQALRNTLVLAVIIVIVPNVLGMLIAMLLDRPARLYRVLRSLFFVPVILSGVVVSVIWQYLLEDGGIVNQVLAALGVGNPPGWLSDPRLALYSVATIISWQVLGFCVVVYLAGLQTIPTELLEASSIDGAGPVQKFRTIVWPMLAPATTITTVMLLITAFKTYDQIQVITNGGPGSGTTSTLAFNVINLAFSANRVGYSSAYAVVMLVLVAAIAVVTLRYLQKREERI